MKSKNRSNNLKLKPLIEEIEVAIQTKLHISDSVGIAVLGCRLGTTPNTVNIKTFKCYLRCK